MNSLLRLAPAVALVLALLFPSVAVAQADWRVGGKIGMSVVSGGGGSDAGFQIGPMGEVILNKNLSVGSEFTINTQGGNPVIWLNYFKYYFAVSGSKIKPYAEAGFLLDIVTGGPYFGILFGGGANFWIAPNLYVPAELHLGPVFADPTLFDIAITTGIRYDIP